MIRSLRIAAALTLLVLVAFAPRAAHAGGPGMLVARFSVLGYETAADGSADPSPDIGTTGNRFFLIGEVVEFGPPLEGAVDPIANQYTVVFSGGSFDEYTPLGSYFIANLNDQTVCRIYEDSRTAGTAATLAPGAPTSMVPASYIDGTEVIRAKIGNTGLLWSTASNDGQLWLNGVDYDGGTLGSLIPEGTNFYHDGAGNLLANLAPPGYPLRSIDVELRFNAGLPAKPVTWGEMKARYR